VVACTYTCGGGMLYSKNTLMQTQDKKQESLVNFKKAHSHLENIIKMVEKGDYCMDIMQQNLAVIGLLKAAHAKLMENHLKGCFANAIQTNSASKQEKMTEEILRVTKMFNK